MGPIAATLWCCPSSKFGVAAEYLLDPASATPTRINTERQAGRDSLDVVIAGALEDILLPLKVREPLELVFILPEIINAKNWRGGDIEYLDPGRTILVMTPFCAAGPPSTRGR